MGTLYLRNVPSDVGEQLARLSARPGMSVSAYVVRELSILARGADNPELLAGLPDLSVDSASVVASIDEGRGER